MLAFAKQLLTLRRSHPVFRRNRFLAGIDASALAWFTPSGSAMTSAEWSDPEARSLAIYLDGADEPDRADDGTPLVDEDFLVLVNGWWEPLGFTIPATRPGQIWHPEIDTFDPAAPADPVEGGGGVLVGSRSIVVLRGSPAR